MAEVGVAQESERTYSRQEIVEELLFMFNQHQCCEDAQMYRALLDEAVREGWKVP